MTSHTAPARPGPARRAVVAVVALLALLLPAAAADGPVAAAPAPAPDVFTGSVDDFYVVPSPLAAGAPGDLIRIQPIAAGPGRTGWRVMYHTTDDLGRDRAVTGIITVPDGPAPAGGWPVVASAHGTTGIASRCAPSRGPALPGGAGVQGIYVAADYVGLGPVGEVHPYLQAAGEANAVLDSVRAAHRLPGVDAADDWLLIGGSQGGHAALVANEAAPARLPEYRLVGTVAIAPGSQFTEHHGDDVQLRIITAMVLFGAQGEDPTIDPAEFLSADAYAAAADVTVNGCLGEIIPRLAGYALTPAFYRVDPDTSPKVRAWKVRNDAGQRVGASPVFLIGAGKDLIVVPARVRALRDRLCALGQPLTYLELPDADHGSAGVQAGAQIAAWLQTRLAGGAVEESCPDVPPGSTTTTTSTTSTTSPTAPTSTTSTTSTSSTSTSTTTPGGTTTSTSVPAPTSTSPVVSPGTDGSRPPRASYSSGGGARPATAIRSYPAYTG